MKDKFLIGGLYFALTAGAVFLINYLEPRAVLGMCILLFWVLGALLNQFVLPHKK
jgi:hypothetical protein